ncbi:uncharacterized protein EI90DRAFT_3014917 [Cantharellus anzutake]|uniref:uncharacterized protein n=1 Tax=Cantharellus anzutake TaxID=1750568 RepID=UPI001904E662|nr:uncharacterized protein EI90DRAFT_3014917 [Cantharellus anzutake]KAF8334654.1 hypothetical protein EI90DRAFT_3014917 [Cantharellus anzutake]
MAVHLPRFWLDHSKSQEPPANIGEHSKLAPSLRSEKPHVLVQLMSVRAFWISTSVGVATVAVEKQGYHTYMDPILAVAGRLTELVDITANSKLCFGPLRGLCKDLSHLD